MIRHILFISYDGMTDPLGQSQVIPYLIKLTRFGYRFTLLSGEKPGRYRLYRQTVEQQLAPYPINWVPVPYHKWPPVLSSVFDNRQLYRKARALHRSDPFDLVHTRVGVPALVGYRLKKKSGIPFLNDIRGFWADERVDGGIWNLRNPVYRLVYRFFRKKEDAFINTADFNTCLTEAARREIHRWPQINNQPIPLEVIPCSADTDFFNPDSVDDKRKQDLRKELGITPDDTVVTYLGSIGGWYLIDEMMRFCRAVQEKLPKVRFLFLSPHLHEVIAAHAAKQGVDPSRLIVKHAQRSEIPALLSLSTYSVFFIKPCYSKISSSPTKHGEIMAMGIPVITNSGVGDVKEIVENADAGWVVDDFSDATFSRLAAGLAEHPAFDRKRIRNEALKVYSLDRAAEIYRRVYERIGNRNS